MNTPGSETSGEDRWIAVAQRIAEVVPVVLGLFLAYTFAGLKGLLFLVGYALSSGASFFAALRFSKPKSIRRFRLLLLAALAPTMVFVLFSSGVMRFAILATGLVALIMFARGRNMYQD